MPGKARNKTSQESNGKKAGKTTAKISRADLSRAVNNILIMPQIAKEKPTPEAKKGRSPKKSPTKSNPSHANNDLNRLVFCITFKERPVLVKNIFILMSKATNQNVTRLIS